MDNYGGLGKKKKGIKEKKKKEKNPKETIEQVKT